MVVDKGGLALLAVFLRDLLELLADERLHLLFGAERRFELGDLLFQRLRLLQAVQDEFLVDVSQLDLGDVFGLDLVDAEADHEVRDDLGVKLRLADDGDGLVDIEKDPAEALEQVQLVLLFVHLEIEPAAHALGPPRGPLLQDLAHAHHARHAGDEDVEVAAEGVLQRRRLKQLLHELVGVGAALEVDGKLEAVQVGLVAHVADLADLVGLDELGDLVEDDLGGGGIGDLIDLDHVPLFDIAPFCPQAERAAARLVDLQHLRRIVEDLAARREIRGRERVEQVHVRVFDERDRRAADLGEVKRADVRRHTDGDAHVGRDEDVREGRRQKDRLLHGAVVVVDKVDGVGVDVAEELLTDRLELRLGVAGGGVGHIAGVDLAEVALGVDEGVQQRLVAAGEADHGLIDGSVAVRVQLHRLADDVGGFCAGLGEKPHLIHGVEQLAVRRLEAVDLRDGARDDDRHGVGHVVRLQRLADRLLKHLRPQPHHIRIVLLSAFRLFFLWHSDSFLIVWRPETAGNSGSWRSHPRRSRFRRRNLSASLRSAPPLSKGRLWACANARLPLSRGAGPKGLRG